jgi:formylglycine-generating enzyme
MSESDDARPPDSSRRTGQPMPRLWKAAAEPTDEDQKQVKKSRKDADAEASKSANKSKTASPAGKAKSAKGKKSAADDDKSEKKVLLEETPKLDTYESRRRVRLIMGTLGTVCVLLLGWIFYRAFLYAPLGFDVTADGDTSASASGTEVRSSLDQEARFMYNKAEEFAKNNQTDQALAMLKKIVKIYKDTSTARDSLAALDRASKKLPLFDDGRTLVVAQSEEQKAPTEPSPPAVINATPIEPQPAQGQAALVLPANPAEVVVGAPGASAKVANLSKAATPQRTLPAGFQANLEMGTHESGWPLVIVGDRDGSPMMLVPGGTFTMGTNESQSTDAPAHQVKLSTYYIDQHEVTNRQFRIFLGESHYRGTPPGKWLTDDKTKAEPEAFPVVLVNFQDAESFATWAGKEIPTEAQWEMAARSTDGRRYPWGDEPAKWSKARDYRQIDPVMTVPEDKSVYGVFDMAGNAQEWTRDWYDPKYYHRFTKTTLENPAGPTPSAHSRSPQRVVRGGSKNWSVTYREGVPHDRRLGYLGFRCVLTVEAPVPAPVTGNPATTPADQPVGKQSKPAAIPF